MTTARRGGKGRPFGIQLLEGAAATGIPLYAQLHRQLREHILSGTLKPGAGLPSARMLSAELAVSRNTVEAAYTQLQSEGFIARRVGAGTVVAATVAEVAPFRPRQGERAVARPGDAVRPASPGALSGRGAQLRRLGVAELASDRSSGPCATDVNSFPLGTWNRLLARHARRGGAGLLRPGDAQGEVSLRQALADHARLTRGVQCDPAQVVVVSSTQQALDLAARLLLDVGDVALVEEPGYPGARGVLQAHGARLRTVPVDAEGLVADALPDDPGRSLLYVTPSHQFPLGVTMTLPRRLSALRWAERTGAWILEDDYDSEFRYDGRPIAALQGLDRAGRVLYLGTCNKVLFPGLRLAYLIVPPSLVDAFVAARRLTDGGSSPLLQSVLGEFLAAGYFAAHLRHARQHYAELRDVLVRAITRQWEPEVTLGPSDTGLHLVAHLRACVNDGALVRGESGEHDLGIGALSRYYAGDERRRGLVVSYGAANPSSIERTICAITPRLHEQSARER